MAAAICEYPYYRDGDVSPRGAIRSIQSTRACRLERF